MLVRSALWAGDHSLVARVVDHGQRLGGGTVDNVHARTSVFCLMVGDAAGRPHQDSLHAALMTDLTTRFGVGKDHPPACTIRKSGLIMIELQLNQMTPSYGSLYRYLTSGGAYPVAWRNGIWQVAVKRAEHPLPNSAIQILVQNVPAALSTHELAAALLAMAGYAPVTPQMGTAPADVVRFNSDPDAVVMLRMRLGRDKATSQPDGGKIVVWVIPPASDPGLRRLPAALYVPGITTSPVLVLLKDDPLVRASVLTPAVHYSPGHPSPAALPAVAAAAIGGGSATLPVTTLPNGVMLPAHLDLDIDVVARASGGPAHGSTSANAGPPAAGAAAGVMPPGPNAPSGSAETAAPLLAAAPEDGGTHVGPASATATEVPPPELGPCSICHEPLSDVDNLVSTSCNHAFHLCCLDKWRAGHNTCPNCRATIPALPGASIDSPGAGGPMREGWAGVLDGFYDSDEEGIAGNTSGFADADRSAGAGDTEGGAAAVLAGGTDSAGGIGTDAGSAVAALPVADSGVGERTASGAGATASGGHIAHSAGVGRVAGGASEVHPDTSMRMPEGGSDVLATGGTAVGHGLHSAGTSVMGAAMRSGSAAPLTASATAPMADAGSPPTDSPPGDDGGDSGGSQGPRVGTPAASGRADRAGSWRASPSRDDEAVALARAAAGRARGGRSTSVNPLAIRSSGYMLRNRSALNPPGSWLTLPGMSGRARAGAMAMEVDLPAVTAAAPSVPLTVPRQSAPAAMASLGLGLGAHVGTSHGPVGTQTLPLQVNSIFGQPILGRSAAMSLPPRPTIFGRPIPDHPASRSPAVDPRTRDQFGSGVSSHATPDRWRDSNPVFYHDQVHGDYYEDDRDPALRHHPERGHGSYDDDEDDSPPARCGPHGMWFGPQRRAP